MGDKNYKWWTADVADTESFSGPYDSREEAIATGHGEYPAADYEAFYIVEADKSVIRASFSEDDIAERIMEQICENNEECFGEDGPDDPWSHHAGAHAALEAALQKAVDGWLADYPGRTFCFDDMRNGEYIETVKEAA